MPRVTMLNIVSNNRYDCDDSFLVAPEGASFVEISDEELKLLEQFKNNLYYKFNFVIAVDKSHEIKTAIQWCINESKKLEEDRIKREKELEEKEKTRREKNELYKKKREEKALERKKKQLEKLKKELEGNDNA